ncbi:MAG: hypothetical protein JSV00_02595 [bacterium]|nr:MAG: hypothetical protein JSV00_02595 [bacterium]
MKRLAVFLVIPLMVLAVAAAAWARPFPATDVRALGMGGAFVAAGDGIGAVQYNPALLGENTTVAVSVPNIVLRLEDHIGLEDLLNDLENLGPTDPAAQDILLRLEQEGGSVDVQGSVSAGAGFSAFGIGAGVSYGSLIFGTAFPSITSTTLPTLAGSLEYRAVEARQIILTGAKSFGNIVVGANLRQIDATVYSGSEDIFTDPGIGIGDVTSGTESDETATAIDVGVLFGLMPMVDVGIVARDVNGPSLGDIDFDPMYRIGAAVRLPMVTIAADLDISENSLEDATEYQEWALGAEFDVWAIALRAGLSNNSGLGGSPTLIHAGVGLGFLDIGAAFAQEGDYYMAGLNLNLGF